VKEAVLPRQVHNAVGRIMGERADIETGSEDVGLDQLCAWIDI
jgi:hypothetical protein